MGFEMKMLISVALIVFILSGLALLALTVWATKTFGPMYKSMGKRMQEFYSLEDEEA